MEGSHESKTVEVEVGYKPEDELVVEKQGTQRDVHDMARMGKIQLLRVNWYPSKSKYLANRRFAAKLRLLFDSWLLHDPYELLGDADSVRNEKGQYRIVVDWEPQNNRFRAYKWWYCRRNIHLHYHLHRFWIGCGLNGGDGIDVRDIR